MAGERNTLILDSHQTIVVATKPPDRKTNLEEGVRECPVVLLQENRNYLESKGMSKESGTLGNQAQPSSEKSPFLNM